MATARPWRVTRMHRRVEVVETLPSIAMRGMISAADAGDCGQPSSTDTQPIGASARESTMVSVSSGRMRAQVDDLDLDALA